MLTHADVWRAIDRLAELHGLSTSGLARRAGLDPTTFNKSKRATPDGRLRWPSTESIAKVLEATGSSLADLVGIHAGTPAARRIPLLHLGQPTNGSPFDLEGKPTGTSWDQIEFPHIDDPNAYGLEVSGDAFEPAYRDGDVLIVSPSATPRRGDRVVLRTRTGELVVARLARQTATRVDLRPFDPNAPERVFVATEIAWLARIFWASQ